MKFCENCGIELSEGETVCPGCGYNAENDTESLNVKTQKSKKNKTLRGILIAIAGVVIWSCIGEFFGKFIGEIVYENVSDYRQKKDIDEYIEGKEEYVPGYCDGNEYVSEKFGFQFVINENWEFYSDEELKVVSETYKDSVISSVYTSLDGEDVSQELTDKLMESVYAATEMGALYIADDMYVGEVMVNVMYAYGIENMSAEDYTETLGNSLNTQVTDAYIAGSTYKVASAAITDIAGNNTTVKMYVIDKDDILCLITCKVLEGYEELFFNAFEDGISAYK